MNKKTKPQDQNESLKLTISDTLNISPTETKLELIQAYQDDLSWSKTLSALASQESEALKLIRDFLADEVELFFESKEGSLSKWRTDEAYGPLPFLINEIIQLGEDSHILAGFYTESVFKRFNKLKVCDQQSLINELYCNLVFLNAIGTAKLAEGDEAFRQGLYVFEGFEVRKTLLTGEPGELNFQTVEANRVLLGLDATANKIRFDQTKSSLLGLLALFQFAETLIYSYLKYQLQTKSKSKHTKSLYRRESFVVEKLVKGQKNCLLAYRTLSTDLFKKYKENSNKKVATLEALAKFKGRTDQGGKRPPPGFDRAFKEALEKIVNIDTNEQLSITHVSKLIREYLIYIHEPRLEWAEPFTEEWFQKHLKRQEYYPEYLSNTAGKSKKKIPATIEKIKRVLKIPHL